jgi:quinate dehydrogenase (quinone)
VEQVSTLQALLTGSRDSASAERVDTGQRGARVGRVVGAVIAAVGLALAGGGLWLLMLGGSPYYIVSGIAYGVSGVLLWRRRPTGAWLAVAVFAATVAWALWEVGFNYWALFPRVLLPAGLAFLALLAALRFPANKSWRIAAHAAGLLGLLIGFQFAFAFVPHGIVHTLSSRPFVSTEQSNEPSNWYSYGRTNAGSRYAPFTQINRDNVQALKPVWTFRSGDSGPGVEQNTSLQIGGLIYMCSRSDRLMAIDADSGKIRWRYNSGAEHVDWAHCRGLGYYELPAASGGGTPAPLCARRIFNATIDARLIAVDALTGKPCADFGQDGVVDLKQGMGVVDPGFYFQSSAPVVARGRIIIGGSVPDNLKVQSPSGVIRAFDARTGALAWAWDMGNPSNTGEPPPGGQYTRATPNMWSTPAYDDSLGLVYVPLGNETPDYFGATRNPASERYSSSITALDIETGRARWSVQTVHHDVWDYDVPSQPALVDVPDGHGGTIPAVLQTTKRGQLFLLNRATGDAISRIVEQPVPQKGAVHEEHLAPTQPYSVDMPAIGTERLTERNAWGMTTLDQLWCRISFKQNRYDGEFTPPGIDPSLQFPGPLGGLNWGSVAIDPQNHIAFMNDLRMASSRTLVPRAEFAKWAARYPQLGLHGHGTGLQAQSGTPYGVYVQAWLSPLGVPCNAPPFGTISAIDLVSHKLLWQVPAGTTEDTGPLGLTTHLPMSLGMPTYAGTTATAGGLLFFAGTQDFYLRAYDTQTGAELWKYRLPVGSSATPMTYVSPKTGRQYVVVSVGGAARSPKTGDYVMAFALPQRTG